MPWYDGSGSVNSGNRPDAFQSNLPESTRMPPMEVPWPPMNFVAEFTTMSAPHSIGRHRAGEALVLSMMSGTPCVMRDLGERLDVEHVQLGVADGLGEDGPGLGR